MSPTLAEGIDDLTGFYKDIAHVQSARAAGEVSRICTELVYGFNECKGECSRDDLKEFQALKAKVDMCMAGSRNAKDRAGNALTEVMIPEALDYPMG